MGHDLRSPLAAISSAAAVLAKTRVEERAGNAVPIIQRSAARMRDLIDNVMDFARGRLGGGLSVTRQPTDTLTSELQHVIDEQQAVFPDRRIQSEFQIDRSVLCDSRRIAQLFANLLANALRKVSGSASTSPRRLHANTMGRSRSPRHVTRRDSLSACRADRQVPSKNSRSAVRYSGKDSMSL
jgi:light-regulated signal transduction histidine kinase (bacteriophytochrome)